MIDAGYLDLNKAVITFVSSIYNLSNAGVYNIVATYWWGGLGHAVSDTRTFKYTLLDCCSVTQAPALPNLNGNLHDSNLSIDVKAFIIPISYGFCYTTITMTVTKGGLSDTSGFV